MIHSLEQIYHSHVFSQAFYILVPHSSKLWIYLTVVVLLLRFVDILVVGKAQKMLKELQTIVERRSWLIRTRRISREQEYLTM